MISNGLICVHRSLHTVSQTIIGDDAELSLILVQRSFSKHAPLLQPGHMRASMEMRSHLMALSCVPLRKYSVHSAEALSKTVNSPPCTISAVNSAQESVEPPESKSQRFIQYSGKMSSGIIGERRNAFGRNMSVVYALSMKRNASIGASVNFS